MSGKWRMIWLGVVFLLLAVSANSWAGIVTYTVEDLGGGLFQYNMTLNNPGLAEPISGLNILNGNSVFGLDFTSIIGAPQDVGGNPLADWLFFTPFPPFIDELNYFSLDPAGDVAIGDSLSGFFFQSATNPLALTPGDFAIEVVFASGVKGPQEDAQLIPEPSTFILFSIAILALIFIKVSRRSNRMSKL